MLRHYDKIGLLVPQYVDEYTGYRYYSSEQLVRANRIVALKSMGFGLKEIEEIKWNNSCDNELQVLLRGKLESKHKEIEVLQMQIRRINEALVSAGRNKYAISVAIKTIPAHKAISLRDRIYDFPEEGRLWKKLTEECDRLNVKVSAFCSAVAIQHEINYEENYIDVEVQLSVDKMMKDTGSLSFRQVPEHEVASVMFQGTYSQIGAINLYAAKWIEQNGYEVDGDVFCIYHNSPKDERDENNYITEVCFPVRVRYEKI
jgi:DNA-binding transcriptional MerR regulator